MVQNNDDNPTTNRGINVSSEHLPPAHRYSETSSLSYSNPSFTDIRNDIQNVLDMMGPTTPTLSTTCNTSSEADNEESVSSQSERKSFEKRDRSESDTPTSSSILKVSERNKSVCSQNSAQTRTTFSNKDVSQMADAGTHSGTNYENFEDFEYSCCNHAHVRINPPGCMCMMGYRASVPVIPSRRVSSRSTRVTVECKKRGIFEWIKERSFDMLIKKPSDNPCDLYKINICGQEGNGVPPKRVVFDLIEGIPKPNSSTVATNTVRNPVEKVKTNASKAENFDNKTVNSNHGKDVKNMANAAMTNQGPSKIQKNISFDSDGNTRIDYYYFDHGNAEYFHTTDTPPVMKYEILAEKTERYTTKFWAEFFASIHIGVSFFISFILQFFKFLLYSIIRPLGVGLMQMTSDYCFKPFLTISFNGLIQPFLIFLYNIATSIRDLCDPIAEAFGYFCREVAVVFRAIRLCSYKTTGHEFDCGCDTKKKCEC